MGFSDLGFTNKLLPLNIQLFAGSVSIVEAYETNKSTANNTNDIYVKVRISTSGATWNQDGNAHCVVTASSSLDTKSGTQYFKISQNSSIDLGFSLGSFRHHNDGSLGNINLSVYVYITSSTQPTTSGSVWASTIPRYANITKFNVQNISGFDGLTKVKYDWSADANCDWVWYSIDNGSTWNNLPNSNIISGLSEGSNYNFKLRVRRSDSQLTTTSGTVNKSTHTRNKISSFVYPENLSFGTNGKELRVIANSPSGSSNNIKLSLYGQDYSITHENTLDTVFTEEEMNSFMEYIPNNASATLVATAETLGSDGLVYYLNELIGNYQIINSDPLFYDFRFLDINSVTKNLTGNNQDCIVGYSYMKAQVPVEMKAVAQNYATMSKYRYTIGNNAKDFEYNDTAPIIDMVLEDVSGNLIPASSGTMQVYAVDSRGFSTVVTKLANNIINYKNLQKTDVGSAKRVDEDGQVIGVSETTQITFGGTIWNGNFGAIENTIKSVSYRFKKANAPEWTDGTTPINIVVDDNGEFNFKGNIKGDTDLGFDISNVYIIEVVVTDELSSVTYTITLGSGKPHVAYSRDGVAIMGKYDEELGGAEQVHGDLVVRGKLISLTGNGEVTGDTLPIGSQIPFAGEIIPENWLLCDGSEVSRTEYAELFAIIGTSYGAGDGVTTFNLPDKRGKVSVGLNSSDSDFNTLGKNGGSKNHSHPLSANGYSTMNLGGTGIYYTEIETPLRVDNYKLTISGSSGASTESRKWGAALGGNTDSNKSLQPYQVDNWIIKAFQSAGVVATVSNTKSDSQTDTYSCDFINKTQEKSVGILYYKNTTTRGSQWANKKIICSGGNSVGKNITVDTENSVIKVKNCKAVKVSAVIHITSSSYSYKSNFVIGIGANEYEFLNETNNRDYVVSEFIAVLDGAEANIYVAKYTGSTDNYLYTNDSYNFLSVELIGEGV